MQHVQASNAEGRLLWSYSAWQLLKPNVHNIVPRPCSSSQPCAAAGLGTSCVPVLLEVLRDGFLHRLSCTVRFGVQQCLGILDTALCNNKDIPCMAAGLVQHKTHWPCRRSRFQGVHQPPTSFEGRCPKGQASQTLWVKPARLDAHVP